MRIVGGNHKGHQLVAPKGLDVRPTTDRVREALFNVLTHGPFLAAGLDGLRVLDLFAGSGALGLEALSRGAAFALFVEQAAAARGAIQQNIEALGLTGHTKVFRRDALELGHRPANVASPFELVFLDPPYGKSFGPQALRQAHQQGWLAPQARAVLEISAKEELANVDGFTVEDRRLYGDTQIVFLASSDRPAWAVSGGRTSVRYRQA